MGSGRRSSRNRGLAERLLRHVQVNRLFPEPGLALLAVSGGPDSCALLDLFTVIAPETGLELRIGHVDHGIAADSGVTAATVESLAARYAIPFHMKRVHLGNDASETEAREARYRALRQLQDAMGARYLITAHHLEDQAETVLLRTLKGSGIAGLAGMRPIAPGGLVRPLLPFRRQELQSWLAARASETGLGISTHDDPANRDPRHERSWLRHRIMPMLEERLGADLAERLRRVAESAQEDREAWALALRALPNLDFSVDTHGASLARVPLSRYDKVLSEALLRALAREVGCILGAERMSRLLDLVRTGQSGRWLELGQGWEAELSFDRVRLLPTSTRGPVPPAREIDGAHGTLRWGHWEFAWRSEPAGRVARQGSITWLIPGPVSVRAPEPGDRMAPVGGVGRRKVRRLLMEARVPFRERGRHAVLEREGEILWVPGVCRAAAAVPQPGEPAVRIWARWLGGSGKPEASEEATTRRLDG